MTRRDEGFRAALDDIERERQRERRARSVAQRTAAREAHDEQEDRELRRARFRALHRAAPEERQRVEDLHDGFEADALRERAAATRRPPPPSDLDGGRGSDSGAPADPPRPTYRNPD
ncbi:MAG: hypothetical protein Q8K79_17385 [Solirubrobacteraceae bacterium]|nr:hypothetical protein [Solirubrobacteraceae bacterium]